MLCQVTEGGFAHIDRTRENNWAEEAEHEVFNQGDGRETVSRSFGGAVEEVLIKTCNIV